jgi:hypothetical protein
MHDHSNETRELISDVVRSETEIDIEFHILSNFSLIKNILINYIFQFSIKMLVLL